MGSEATELSESISIEEYLATTLSEVDALRAAAGAARDHRALRLKALEMSHDERVNAAVKDHRHRADEGLHFEDAVSVGDLVASSRARR